MEFDIFYLTV